jgi:hypothetical protein
MHENCLFQDVSSVPHVLSRAERLQNARTLGTLKKKVFYLSSASSSAPASFQITGNVWRSLEVTLEVMVKVNLPILTAPAPWTQWHPSLCSPTHFAHFYCETLKESQEQKKWQPLCREVACDTYSGVKSFSGEKLTVGMIVDLQKED